MLVYLKHSNTSKSVHSHHFYPTRVKGILLFEMILVLYVTTLSQHSL